MTDIQIIEQFKPPRKEAINATLCDINNVNFEEIQTGYNYYKRQLEYSREWRSRNREAINEKNKADATR